MARVVKAPKKVAEKSPVIGIERITTQMLMDSQQDIERVQEDYGKMIFDLAGKVAALEKAIPFLLERSEDYTEKIARILAYLPEDLPARIDEVGEHSEAINKINSKIEFLNARGNEIQRYANAVQDQVHATKRQLADINNVKTSDMRTEAGALLILSLILVIALIAFALIYG